MANKNDEKIYMYADGFFLIFILFFFFAIEHLQKALITTSSENVPEFQSSVYKRKYPLFKQNV